ASLLATSLKARSCVAAGRLQAGSYREGATCRGVGDIFRHVTPYLVHQARLRKMSLTPCADTLRTGKARRKSATGQTHCKNATCQDVTRTGTRRKFCRVSGTCFWTR